MKTRNIIGVLAIAGLAYYLLSKKKPAKEIGKMADTQDKPIPDSVKQIANILMPTAKPVTVEDIKVPVKQPLYIQPTNAIPDLYDRGVGLPIASLSASGQNRYYNQSGICSEDINKACRCQTNSTSKFKADIPTLP